jgi:hypothetical protein
MGREIYLYTIGINGCSLGRHDRLAVLIRASVIERNINNEESSNDAHDDIYYYT